ncbi:hypothetical protein BDZ90DRAFT_234650 [Jaminaea rosea]|uniref:3-hydroxybutyryl-CoA dehydrogenase n=1 Tax=Jaminaea rosea TaxID=1569628 RepID=A0A316UH86_9BASI|nr:hypothetical protein BDZ90DRAFT_234650 [Jaminaea rosea]PWN24687.1 hypothetical protein BDZ90DRAFT_234650 [Jaminaea rosea]
MANPITKIAVTGAGQMGLGIAYVAAVNARASVRLYDGNVKALDKGVAFFESLLAKDVKKNKMTQQQADEARGRLSIIKDLEALGDKPPEMVCEAIVENLGAKQDLFKRLANIVPVETILATNTSSISVSKIASAAVREKFQGGERDRESPARVLSAHFMWPVPVSTVVEVIPALQTSPEVLSRVIEFVEKQLGKRVVASKDRPGFIANRLLCPMLNEAILLLDESVATREDIDATMKMAMRHPQGPLELADTIGLDTVLSIMETLHRETGDSKYRPAALLSRMVDAGWYGRKSGKGFYDY